MITSVELRKKYLEFFKSKGHAIMPSASLIPENDPTVLFTTAGMHPLVPYLLGAKHPAGIRLANVQKCVRVGDIDEVGDNSHLTFFEMLGNWSLGDYFKKEVVAWSWEFLTSSEYLGLDKRKLSATVFGGDKRYPDIPKDDEAADIWKSIGMPEERIAYMPGGVLEREDNWWGPAGQTGPCGSSTEMFYWQGESEFPPAGSNPGTDEENWLEIWNDVFMQYDKTKEGAFVPLKQKNVDTGMGLDRTIRVLNGFVDIFQIDTFWPLIQKIQDISGHEYIENIEITKSMRIVADHIRTATMIMGDDHSIAPSNVDQGYIVRRMIRRAVRHGRVLGITENFCSQIAEEVIKIFADVYPEVERNREFVLTEIAREESKFRNTVEKGLFILDRELKASVVQPGSELNPLNVHVENGMLNYTPTKITGKWLFDFYQSFGFPFEIAIEEIEKRRGKFIDHEIKELKEEFDRFMVEHQSLSRQGAEQKFKGGLADTSETSTKYHTATHLLQAALRAVLGDHIGQKGSNITAERLRFDFSHPEKMTDEQKKRVEDLVNYAIQHNYEVTFEEMTLEDAQKRGAVGLFADRYGEKVKVYSVGDPMTAPGAFENSLTFSKEVCGGPHVEHTGDLGKFKIVKEEAVSSGVRRIKAVLE